MKVLWFRASFPCLQSAITGNFHNFNATITYHYATTSLRWVVYSGALFMCKLWCSVANFGCRNSVQRCWYHWRTVWGELDSAVPEIHIFWKDSYIAKFGSLIILPWTFYKWANFAFWWPLTCFALLYESLWCKQEDPEIFWWIRLSFANLSELLQGLATLCELLQKRFLIFWFIYYDYKKDMVAPHEIIPK